MMMSTVDERRARAPNFTTEEKMRIIELVSSRKHIIENKRTDGVTQIEKKEEWECICNEFNSEIGSHKRSANQIKTCYDNIKHDTKKKYFAEKRELYLTGGGTPKNTGESQIHERALQLIGKSVRPLTNATDSGAAYHALDNSTASDIIYENEEIETVSDVEVIDSETTSETTRFKKRKPRMLKSVYDNVLSIATSKKEQQKSEGEYQKTLCEIKLEQHKLQMQILQEELIFAQKKNEKIDIEIRIARMQEEETLMKNY